MTIWITQPGFLGTFTEGVNTSTRVIATGTNITYSLISGNLPDGLNLSSTGTIFGTPNNVLTVTNSKFVIRAQLTSGTNIVKVDRTFNIDIFGPTAPNWNLANTTITTTSGTTIYFGTFTVNATELPYLNLGINKQPYALTNQYIDYQFSATNVTSPSNSKISYSIKENEGILPPNLNLSNTGTVSGYIENKLKYDIFSYNYPQVISTRTELIPKVYSFYATADNGGAKSKQLFRTLVVNPDFFTVDNTELVYNTSTFFDVNHTLTTDVSSLQSPQFIYGNDLGTIRAENNIILDVRAYDPNPLKGPVIYDLITGTTFLSNLPNELELDKETGYIYGYIPYQPAYSKTYNFQIAATKIDKVGHRTTATNFFTLKVKGEVESTIEWITDSDLGNLTTGEITELFVEAKLINSTYNIKYQLIDGNLPPGLTLLPDGTIAGSAQYGNNGSYTFTVRAQDIYELSAIDRTFNLNLIDDIKRYTSIYIKTFLSQEKRSLYTNFTNDTAIFDPKFIYRYFDLNFGVQKDIKVVLEFGIEQTSLSVLQNSLEENFYRKQFYFGDIKIALAKNSQGLVVYELVYADVIDQLVNNDNISVSQTVNFGSVDYYPASIDNMKKKLRNIILPNFSTISINENSEPMFMKTKQDANTEPGYMRVIPICYAKPGQGNKILNRISFSKFDFKQFYIEADRFVVKDSLNESGEKYVFFPKQSIKN